MIHDLTRERLQGWVADFCAGDGVDVHPPPVREHGEALLTAWLVAACELRDVEPEDLAPDDLRTALTQTVARLDLPDAVHEGVPALCRDLLADLEQTGRLADGRTLGLSVAAGHAAYADAVAGRVRPIVRPGSKLGRNDPCPCGSGKKYKRCCMGGLA